MIGPMDFTMNDESGVMIEGFERVPMIKQPWHPPYYQRRARGGRAWARRWTCSCGSCRSPTARRSCPSSSSSPDEVEPRHGIRLRKMSRRSLRKDMDRFADVYNSAWSENWGFSPYSKKDLDAYTQELQLVFDQHWFMVAETAEGETAAVAITVPDVNQVLAKMKGRLLPFGWWHFLRKGRTIDRVRVGFLGVKPEFQHTGVAAKMYVEHFDMASATPQTWGEMGWILETNTNMNRAMEAMGGRVVRRYRVYERELGENPTVRPRSPKG